MCSGLFDTYAVTERVHLLKDIASISKVEAFIVISDVVKGLPILFEKFGPFTPKLNTIGVNSEGRARIWISENFADYETEKDTIPAPNTELAVVNTLVRLIERKATENSSFNVPFPRNLNFKSASTYTEEALKSAGSSSVDRVYLDRGEFKKRDREQR